MANPTLTTKQLQAIEKSMVALVDDADKVEKIKETFEEFRKALGDGEAVTSNDVDAALEVLLEQPVAKSAETELPDDPMAPIFDDLYRQMAPIAKKAGVSVQKLQEMFHKAYGQSVEELDGAITATAETVIGELGGDVAKAKDKKPAEKDDDDDEDCDDMEKILKRVGVPAALAKRIGGMQVELAALTHDKAMGLFEKRAAAVGEPGLAADLLKIHEVDPKLCDRIEQLLKGKNEILRKSKGWSAEIGDGAGAAAEGVAGPLNQLEGHAREIQKNRKGAGGKTMSFSKAFSMACDENPELYAEYNQEKHRQIARGA